jgi:hypothetical protein
LRLLRPNLLATIVVEKWARAFTCDHKGGKKETKTRFRPRGGGYGPKIPVTSNVNRETNKTQRRQSTLNLLWPILLAAIVVDRSGLGLSLATARVERRRVASEFRPMWRCFTYKCA